MQAPDTMFQDGAAYERLMGRWSQRVGTAFLDWLAPAPGLDWLDAGCGNGAFTELIARQGLPRYLAGIDPSPAQVAFACQRLGAAAAIEVGMAQALPFADATFDVCTLALVIAFIAEPARGVGELVRVTRPGGMVAAYMWDLPDGVPLAPMQRALLALGHPAPLPPSAPASNARALLGQWRDAGLIEVDSRAFPITVSFEDFDDFWQTNLLPVGPLAATLHGLSQAERDRLRAHLMNSLPADRRGRIAYPAWANAIKGRRPRVG